MVAHAHPTVREKVGAGEAGYGLGIAGFISSFFAGVVGIVLSAIALSQSKKIGKGNTFAVAGLIIGIVTTVLGLLSLAASIFGVVALVRYCDANPDKCQDNSSSSMYYNDNGDPSQDNSTTDPQRTY